MPSVSVVIPCHNEALRLPLVLRALAAQTCLPDEIIVVDSASTDQTVNVAQESARTLQLPVRIVANPRATIPSSLNCGISAAQSEIIVRLDGHCQPEADYLAQCLAVFAETKIRHALINVGGRWQIRPGAETATARTIAIAVSTRLGAGDASYRLGNAPAADVDTVPFGCFFRHTWLELGKYNENLLSNEDYEFNTRLRQQGGIVRFDPRIQCAYFARATIGALWKQYWRYGWWKARMLRGHWQSLRLRQLLPLGWVAFAVLAPLVGMRWQMLGYLAMAGWLVYLLTMLGESARVASRHKLPLAEATRLPLVYACVHFAWGLGFWASAISSVVRPTRSVTTLP